MEQNQAICEGILDNIDKVIIGKRETAELILAAMLAGGHVLLEDMPGTGKTKLAKTLAKSIDLRFSRVQFTPDLLPSDVTGLNVYNRKEEVFELRKGPVFTDLLLADEINRATPRTQAGLLECMEEKQVTIDGKTYPLSDLFFVIATQNPIETSGTFPLPEAQLDRFMLKLSLGQPEKGEELKIMERYMGKDPYEEVCPVTTPEQIYQAREQAQHVFVHESIREYIVELIQKTREREDVLAGVSTRGSLALMQCAKAYAWIHNRNYMIPDDIKTLAEPVLAHRIVYAGAYQKKRANQIIREILDNTKVPTEEFSR